MCDCATAAWVGCTTSAAQRLCEDFGSGRPKAEEDFLKKSISDINLNFFQSSDRNSWRRGRPKWKISILRLYREFPDIFDENLNDRRSCGVPNIKCIKIKKRANIHFFGICQFLWLEFFHRSRWQRISLRIPKQSFSKISHKNSVSIKNIFWADGFS